MNFRGFQKFFILFLEKACYNIQKLLSWERCHALLGTAVECPLLFLSLLLLEF